MREAWLWTGLAVGLLGLTAGPGATAGPGPFRDSGPDKGVDPSAVRAPSVHVEAPPAGHSGGFGEPTCVACHAEFPVNEPGGRLRLEGLPESYEPNREYALSVILEVPETVRAGFQLTARSPDGRQAGGWNPPSPGVAVVDSAGVAYAYGTEAGSRPASPDLAAWTLVWVAPASGPVHFHLAANSANGDDSPFGDLVYAVEVKLDRAR